MTDIVHLSSISQMMKALGEDSPKHPLIYVMDITKLEVPEELQNQKMTTSFYTISLKDGNCAMQYGRNAYDFEEGVLAFTAPDQVISADGEADVSYGWMLIFHPDLIRKSNLGKHIQDYNFFSYDVHEALHLSKKEEEILNDCVSKVEFELDQNIDGHSQNLLISNIELLLNYCNRFYERQFHTRADHHKDVVTNIKDAIKNYYASNAQLESGTPTVKHLADQVSLSANYLSDLLKKETGKNAKEHINDFVIDKAKTMLLNTEGNVSEIAYNLGFNYPHYFSRLFKQKAGVTPQKYRESNWN
jgi:AraC-like DNA-binding protein